MPEPITIVGLGSGILGLLMHLARRYFDVAKEVVDVLLGAVLLLVCAPVIAACGLLILLADGRPVFFTQLRVGRWGKCFQMYKLRTMRRDAEAASGAVWAGRKDPRVIPLCRWMRRSHLDELPQLLNVLRGQMAIVGPRPERPAIHERLRDLYPDVDKRLEVRPGITGLAQLRAGYDTDLEHFRTKLDNDLDYIARRRWGLDLGILVRTLGKFHDNAAH